MAFFSRGFILLWQGQLVSQLGNQAFLIAATYFALEKTGSTTLVGAVMMASTVPLVLLGPFGGTIADRHSRRAILIVTDLLRGLAVGALGLVLLWRPDAATIHMLLLVLVAIFSGIMAALFAPAVQAIVPDLVQNDRLASANSVSQVTSQAAILVGQAAGGVLYLSSGAAWLLLLDALSFGYAALATWFIPADRVPPQRRVSTWLVMRQYVVETQQGMAYVRRRGIMVLLVVFASVNFLFMPVFVLLPLYVRSILGGGPDWYGFLLAGSGGGALFGAGFAGLLLTKVRAHNTLLRACVGGVGCCVVALAVTNAAAVALPLFVAIGVFSSVINVAVITTFQSAVPTEIRGRVMALVVAVSTAAVPIGMGLGGVMGDLWRESLAAVFAACGGAIVLLGVLGLGFSEARRALSARDAFPQFSDDQV
jgi:DHA3 family macrolide efflux protein-like MFS transporter